MPRQIIVLDITPGNLGTTMYRIAYWVPVPPGHQYPKDNFQSALNQSLFPYASPSLVPLLQPVQPAEQSAFLNGSVVEIVKIHELPSDYQAAELKAFFQRTFTNMANAMPGQPSPLVYYGDSFDGTNWLL